MFFEKGNSSVIELVNDVIEKAISVRASDIHLEPFEDSLNVRYRVDGLLLEQKSISGALSSQVTSRVKVLANIDIAEKRVPQDGKFHFPILGNDVDLRVSTFPSIYGEKIVIRILDRDDQNIQLNQLGMPKNILDVFDSMISKSSGFILVTGPTGSGKTTTLYAALNQLNSTDKNIITLEDPVEYKLEGITQGQVNNDAGFTFARGIRSLFRQDPDIAMVGEARDKETAQIAIEAALTGHLVFSTLHTNDAPGSIVRLMDMGVEPFLINASITGVLAQRLVRKLCVHCRKEVDPDEQDKELLKRLKLSVKKLYKATGCYECSDVGCKGRTGIFELMVVTDALRSLIIKQPIFDQIYKQVVSDGMSTLRDDAEQKLKDGIISLKEFARVIL